MCWTTNRAEFAVKKTAEQDIPVFKIVRYKKIKIYMDDEITTKITSYFQGYEYTLGKQVESEMKIETKMMIGPVTLPTSPRINTGLHSYDMKLRKTLLHVDGINYIYGLDGGFVQAYSTYVSAIMHCVIPAGAEYYENERGEIVSNKLRTVSIEEI